MGRMLRRVREWMIEYAYLVTLCCVLAIVVGSAIYTRQVRREDETGVQAAADAPEIEETASLVPTVTVTPLPTIAPLTVRPVALVSAGTTWPVDGAVLRGFDTQELVLWETLDSWRTHTALDIAGEAGESVVCSADGKVKSSTWDELWGWRVTVDQADGRQVTYAGLESSVVSIGESVTRGQTIGTLLEAIPCEAEIGAHLHLEVRHNGAAQDPETMLPER